MQQMCNQKGMWATQLLVRVTCSSIAARHCLRCLNRHDRSMMKQEVAHAMQMNLSSCAEVFHSISQVDVQRCTFSLVHLDDFDQMK